MAGINELLRELHRLRRHARDLNAEIERGPRVLKSQQTKLAKQEDALKDATEGLKRTKVATHEREVTLKTTNQQIAKYEKQQNEVTSKKESDALKTQIETARQQCAALEDEILAGLGEIDERTAKLPEIEKATQLARTEFAGFEKEAQERLTRLGEELARTRAQLAETEKGIPGDVRGQYDRLVKSYDADGFAELKDGSCSFCYNGITAQYILQLRSNMFVTCNSCGRALYLG